MKKLPIFNGRQGPGVERRGPSKSPSPAIRCCRPLDPGSRTLFGAALLAGIMVLEPLSVTQGQRAANQANVDEAQPDGVSERTEILPAPTKILQSARDKLQEYRPIKATIVERVAIGDRRFKAEGSYVHGPNLKLRLEFRVRLGAADDGLDGSLLQVCDGQVLWTRQKIGDEVQVTRRDVRQILRAAEGRQDITHSLLVADLGLGGVPAVLASLETAMNFQTTVEERIGDDVFLMIEGTWKDEFLNRWTGGGPSDGTSEEGKSEEDEEQLFPPRLPQHLPEQVRVYFDQKTLFPRRIQYLKRPAGREFFRPLVTLDFVKIVLNASVNDEDFYFVPGDGVFQQDITIQYLRALESGSGADQGDAAAQPTGPQPTAPQRIGPQ